MVPKCLPSLAIGSAKVERQMFSTNAARDSACKPPFIVCWLFRKHAPQRLYPNRGTNVQSMRTQAEWVGRGLYTAPARARSGDVATIEHVHTHTPPTQRSIAIDQQQRSQPRPPAAAYRRHSTHVRTFPRALPLSSARLGPGLLRHPLQARLSCQCLVSSADIRAIALTGDLRNLIRMRRCIGVRIFLHTTCEHTYGTPNVRTSRRSRRPTREHCTKVKTLGELRMRGTAN